MLYRCLPAAREVVTLRRPAKGKRRRSRPFTVDIHCHLLTPAADELVKPYFKPESEPLFRFSNEATREVNRLQSLATHDKITSVETRLKVMDKAGIDVQAISPAPFQYYYWAEPELGRASARLVNDNIAQIVARHPERFVGLATVPLQAPSLAIAELERAV